MISGGCHEPRPPFLAFFGACGAALTAISDTFAGCRACWVFGIDGIASEFTTLTKQMSVD